MSKIHLINNAITAEKRIYKLLEEEPTVGLVCKGINIGSDDGVLALVAVSTPNGSVYIFDIRADKNIILNGGLVRLIESVDNTKVMHASKVQATVLYNEYGIKLKQVFDVQEKYGDLMVKRGLPRRYLLLPDILSRYNIDTYTPSTKLQRLIREDRNVWTRRPLTKDMLNTVASEVLPLVPSLYVTLYRCLGLEDQPDDSPQLSSRSITTADDASPVSTSRLPVYHKTSSKPLSLPTNYLHIHLTK